MRQTSVIALLIALSVIASGPAHAQRDVRESRTSYQTPAVGAWVFAPGHEVTAYGFNCAMAVGCVAFDLKRHERFASFEVRDATGLPVFASIWDDEFLGGNLLGTFCGEMPEPVDLQGRGRIFVHVTPGTCPDLTPSAPTTGVVEATFYRRR